VSVVGGKECVLCDGLQQQKDSKLNQDDLDLNDHFYEKVIFRRVRMFTPRFLPWGKHSYPAIITLG
jgi:hypothetical protein